jgi:hypothetical protein
MQRPSHDIDADLLVAVCRLERIEHPRRIEERDAAARDNAFLGRGAPNDFWMRTFRPLGPTVALTASARTSTPCSK